MGAGLIRRAEGIIKKDKGWLEAFSVSHFWRMLDVSIFLYLSYSF